MFEGKPIPYPKREFLTDDDNDDKADTGASKVGAKQVRHAFLHLLVSMLFCHDEKQYQTIFIKAL